MLAYPHLEAHEDLEYQEQPFAVVALCLLLTVVAVPVHQETNLLSPPQNIPEKGTILTFIHAFLLVSGQILVS